MRTVGIDLAAQPANTGFAIIDWRHHEAHVAVEVGADDNRLISVALTAHKVGIDAPFGWPVGFVDYLSAHAQHCVLPKFERYRVTDQRVISAAGVNPLSVATDRIGIMASRCARLQIRVKEETGQVVDRAGRGLLVEVYPAAALKAFGLHHQRYKRGKGSVLRGQLVDRLLQDCPELRLNDENLLLLRRSDDALDALICALVACAAAIGLTEPPNASEIGTARVEGWIHLPKEGVGLDDLQIRRTP